MSNDEKKKTVEYWQQRGLIMGMLYGVAIGIPLGLALKNLAIGIAIGAGTGVTYGIALGQIWVKKHLPDAGPVDIIPPERRKYVIISVVAGIVLFGIIVAVYFLR
ncbi:hypothetical protein KQI65_01195 [bacterium]|nr:hypothetical protein [bacterium]